MMSQQIDVLDHGYVRLVDSMGSDMSVVRSARVSYAAEPRLKESTESESKDSKLLKYLIANKHTSPFESVTFTFQVCLPIFVARQWMRHRTWSYNEVSARYTQLDDKFYIPALEQITKQHTSNKQMRTTEQHPSAAMLQRLMKNQAEYSYQVYKEMIEDGCPRELARTVLPVSVYTTMFATVDLHNLFHFLRLRLHTHSQYEIRVYAEAILQLITDIVPECVRLFREQLVEEGILS